MLVRARTEPTYAAMLLVVLLGVVLRARGYLFDRHGLWVDEAAWAMHLMRDPLQTLWLRPIGFMAITKLLAVVFGPWEVVLRLLCWVAGMGVVFLAIPLARYLYRAPAAQLLFVAVLVLHPSAIDLSKEFKPYECSLFGHLLLVLLALRYVDSQRLSHLVVTLVAALVSGLFAQDMVMAYPGLFLVLGWDTLVRRRERVPWVVVGAVAVLLLLAAQYWFIWRHMDAGESSFWGKKYDVFYQPSRRRSFARWWLDRYLEMARFLGLRRRYWNAEWVAPRELDALSVSDGWIWVAVHVAGVVGLFATRRWRVVTLLVVPLLTMTLMNRLGQWPYGAFRANLFVVGYMAAIAGMALESANGRTARWPALVPAFVLVAAPLLLFDRRWNERKLSLGYDTDMALVLRQLVQLEPPPEEGRRILFVSRRSCDTYEYYATLHPRTSRKYKKRLSQTFDVQCYWSLPELIDAINERMPHEDHAWLVTDLSSREVRELRSSIPGIRSPTRLTTQPTKLLELMHGER